MSNTPTNKKNYQQNSTSPDKSRYDNNELSKVNIPSSSGSQKRQKITLKFFAGEEKQQEDYASNSTKDERENSNQKPHKNEKQLEREEFDDRYEKSSSVHVVYNNDNHIKPTIKNVVSIEKFNNQDDKRNKQSAIASPNGKNPMEREIENVNNLKSPSANDSKLYASIVTKKIEIKDRDGNIHQVPKNYMKVKVPKSPKSPRSPNNNNNNNYSTRGAEINPNDEDNFPISERRKLKKKVPRNLPNDYIQENPQHRISPENYNRTPNAFDGEFGQKRNKHKRTKKDYIPDDYNNNKVQYIDIDIVPVDEEPYPKKTSKRNRDKSRPKHIHRSLRNGRHVRKVEKRRPHSTRPSRHRNPSTEYSEYDSYYESSDEEVYSEYESDENRRPSKKKVAKKPTVESESNQENRGLPPIEPENIPEPVQDQLQTPTPTQPFISTPTTAHVGTETNLIRNSSSTQTSFIPNNRANKCVETSSLAGNRNDEFNDEDQFENPEESTNDNVFNSPRERSSVPVSQNFPISQSSPRSFNSPRSPRSPRSPPPTYKSEVDGLTNSIRKTDSPIKTRSSNINFNTEDIPINRVPNSSDDENENDDVEPSISSLDEKIKQITNRRERPQSTKNRDAYLDDSSKQDKQSKKSSSGLGRNVLKSPKESEELTKSGSNQSPKAEFLSESNSPSVREDSNLSNKKGSEYDESYAECVLKPSQGSSALYKQTSNSKLSTHSSNQHSNEIQDRNAEGILDQKRESSHMSAKSSHSKPASKQSTAENSSLKGRNSNVSSTYNLDAPSQNQQNSLTTESTKQPSLLNEGSSKKNLSSKVSFNSNMSRSSNKPSSASKSTINIESEVQDFITPDKKSTASSRKSNSKQNSILSHNSVLSNKSNHSNLGSSIHSNHNLNGSSIHSSHSLNNPSIHSVHHSNGSNSLVSEASQTDKRASILSNSASTYIGEKEPNQISEAFEHLSEFTTSDPDERFIKRRGVDVDSIIDSEVSNNSEISIGSPTQNEKSRTSKSGSVLIEEIEEDEIEEEVTESSAAHNSKSSFSELFQGSKNDSGEGSSEFNIFSSDSKLSPRSRRVNKRFVDPSEHYIKLGLNVLEVKTRDPRKPINENLNETPTFSNSIHEVQIEPAIPTENESLFVQVSFKEQDTFLSTPSKKCIKQEPNEEEEISEDEAFRTKWNSNFYVTGFENSVVLFTLCRSEFSGFKMLASVSIPLSLFKDIPDGWFDLMPEEDDQDEEENPIISMPNSPSSKVKLYGKIHLLTNVESSIVLPPFDIDKQVEIIASKDQIDLSNKNQEEIEKIKAMTYDFSSVSNNDTSFNDDDDLAAQAQKLSRKFNDFRNQFSSVSDVSTALMGSENDHSETRDGDRRRVKKRKINLNSQIDDNTFNSSSSTSRRRRKDRQVDQNSERDASLNESEKFNSASSTSKRRVKVPKNRSSALDDSNISSSHGENSRPKQSKKEKSSEASEGQNFEFEKVSSSSMNSANKKSQNAHNEPVIEEEEEADEINNYLNNVSSTIPETITFDNSSTVVGTSNFTLSGFGSPQKGNQNKKEALNKDDEEDDDESDGLDPISVISDSNNSEAANSIEFAEVKNGKTLSRDAPKRTHVANSNQTKDDLFDDSD